MAKSSRKAGRKAAPRASRDGASKPGDKMRLQSHGVEMSGTIEDKVAQSAGAAAGERARAMDDMRDGDGGGERAAHKPSAMKNLKRKAR